MTFYIDFHEDLTLPAEAIAQIADDIRTGRADQFGIRYVELYHHPDGKVYCLLERPDEDAIRQHHAALGVPCGDVYQVAPLPDRHKDSRSTVGSPRPVGEALQGTRARPDPKHDN